MIGILTGQVVLCVQRDGGQIGGLLTRTMLPNTFNVTLADTGIDCMTGSRVHKMPARENCI